MNSIVLNKTTADVAKPHSLRSSSKSSSVEGVAVVMANMSNVSNDEVSKPAKPMKPCEFCKVTDTFVFVSSYSYSRLFDRYSIFFFLFVLF